MFLLVFFYVRFHPAECGFLKRGCLKINFLKNIFYTWKVSGVAPVYALNSGYLFTATLEVAIAEISGT